MSPLKRNANGARNQFYEYMREVEPRDIVFSFFDTRIQGIGIVTARADTAPKPQFGPTGQSDNWSQEGWLVGVEYTKLETPFRPKDHIELIRPLLPTKYFTPAEQRKWSPVGLSGRDLRGARR
jgi:hypothetical protein